MLLLLLLFRAKSPSGISSPHAKAKGLVVRFGWWILRLGLLGLAMVSALVVPMLADFRPSLPLLAFVPAVATMAKRGRSRRRNGTRPRSHFISEDSSFAAQQRTPPSDSHLSPVADDKFFCLVLNPHGLLLSLLFFFSNRNDWTTKLETPPN